MTGYGHNEDEPVLYDTVNGERVMTDGGTAAVGSAGGGLGPGGTDPAGVLAGNGDGFEQFTALAAKDTAPDGSALQANAAQQAAQFRANSRLRKDEWKTLDERLVEIAQANLVLVDELRSRGLTVNEDLATLIREWESTNEFDDADVDMSGETGASEDASTFTLNGTPLPIVHKSFHVKRRQLLASRRRGQGLDLSNQSKAARKVMEGLEDVLINGWDSTVDGYTVYGLTNHPDRNTVTGSDWNDFTNNDADTVRGDILDAVEANEDANYGPEGAGYLFAGGRDAYQALRRWDTGTDQERGLLERLNEELDMIQSWIRADYMADDEAVLFKPVPDVLELANASDIQNVEWESDSGWTMHMKVMASMTPIVKSDDDGNSGICHLTDLLA